MIRLLTLSIVFFLSQQSVGISDVGGDVRYPGKYREYKKVEARGDWRDGSRGAAWEGIVAAICSNLGLDPYSEWSAYWFTECVSRRLERLTK